MKISLHAELALSMFGYARAQCKLKGNGKAVRIEVFFPETKADNGLAKLQRHANTPPSLLYEFEEIGRTLTKKQKNAFPKTLRDNKNGSRKIKVKEQAPKMLILKSKATRLLAF